MVKETIAITNSRIIIYFNSDILFHRNIIMLINYIINNNGVIYKKVLMVGKRGDVFWKNISNNKNYDYIWNISKLHSGSGIDYFIFTSFTFSKSDIKILSEIVVGRVRYDNIILALAMKNKNNLVFDTTKFVKAIHLSLSQEEKEQLTNV